MNPELNPYALPVVATFQEHGPSGTDYVLTNVIRSDGRMLVTTVLSPTGIVVERFAEVLEPVRNAEPWTGPLNSEHFGAKDVDMDGDRTVFVRGTQYVASWADVVLLGAAVDEPEASNDEQAVSGNPHNVRMLADSGHVFGQWSPEPLTADTSEWLEDAVMADLQEDGSVAVTLHANIPANLDSGGDADATIRLVLPREVAESIAYLILGH